MSNLLKSDFYKLFKMKSFYVCCIVAAGVAVVTMALYAAINAIYTSLFASMSETAANYVTVNDIIPSLFQPGDWFILAIIAISVFVTIEYNAGTLKNIVTRGFKREHIFLSKLIVCIVEALIITFVFALAAIIFGFILLGISESDFSSINWGETFAIYGVDILVIISYTSFITMIAYLIRSRGGTIAIALCAHYLIPTILTMAYTVESVASDSSMNVVTNAISTADKYGSFAYCWIGTVGGMVQNSISKGEVYIPIIVAAAYLVVSCAIGLVVFKKRDIK